MAMKNKTKQQLTGYGFISLWIIGFLAFTLVPLVKTFMLSFKDVKITTDGITTVDVGLKNYKNAFLMDVSFTQTLIEYIFEILIIVIIVVVFALIIALMLNMNIKFKGIFRTIFFLPVIISSGPVIEELMSQGATSLPGLDNYTFITQLTSSLPGVLGNLVSMIISSFILILWFAGVQILIFLAGLQKMDPAIYEASSIDGASRWEAFWKITLPALKPMIIVNVVYTIITISLFSVNKVIVLIQQNVYSEKTGLGYASALSWIYFIVLLLLLAFYVGIISFKGKKKKYSIN